jgi:hypothetical protein
MLAIAAAGIPVSLASVVAGPASAAVHPAKAALPAATAYSTAGDLAGVAAASDSSAWAVGYAWTGISEKILMLHWNGSRWSRVTSPKADLALERHGMARGDQPRDGRAVARAGIRDCELRMGGWCEQIRNPHRALERPFLELTPSPGGAITGRDAQARRTGDTRQRRRIQVGAPSRPGPWPTA